MELKLKQAEKVDHVLAKGDIIVMKSRLSDDSYVHYLVIEEVPLKEFTILNMNSNNLMSSVRKISTSHLISAIKCTFPQLEFVEIIPADQFEVVRKS